MRRIALGIALLAAVAFLAAGCGGGGGGDQLSAEEYSSQLNSICTDFNQKQKDVGAPTDLADLGKKGQQILDLFDEAISQVGDLNPPDELQEAHDKFVDLGKQQRDLLQQTVDAANDGDQAKAEELVAKAQPLDSESDKIVTDELKAPACAA